jgi:hypothetical protein
MLFSLTRNIICIVWTRKVRQSLKMRLLTLWSRVRKYAYREYYFPEAMDTGNGTSPLTELDQAHLSHCLSMLRQALTCNPSLGILTHNVKAHTCLTPI